MGVPTFPVHVYDTKTHARAALRDLYGPSLEQRIHLGPCAGDILNLEPSEMTYVDGIVSGPPCPPFSSIGSRKGDSDVRARVFEKVVEIIIALGKKGAIFFIIENVPGILHQRGCAGSYAEKFLMSLSSAAPFWKVHVWHLNARDFGLAQHRERVFFVGLNQMRVQNINVSCPSPFPVCPHIDDFLCQQLAPVNTFSLTPNQRWNLLAYKQALGFHLQFGQGVAVISVDRSLSASSFGEWIRTDSLAPTLRTANQYLFLMRLGNGPPLARLLHPMERWALMGFSPTVGLGMSKQQVLEATGNAYAVPVLGAVLAELLRCVHPCLVLKVHRTLSLPEDEQAERKHRRLD